MHERQISVVVATRNSVATLDWTLLSLRRQHDCDVRILVADSDSTDGTLEICQRWDVPAINVMQGNMYRAINAGLAQCQTDWFAYINSDDWVYPNSFVRLIERGEATGADIVYGDCDYMDESGRFLYSFAAANPDQLSSLFRLGTSLPFAQPAAIFQRKIYKELQGFNEAYLFSADSDFYFRAVLAGARFVRLKGPSSACFRLHEGQLSRTKQPAIRLEQKDMRDRLAGRIQVLDWARLARWRMANMPHYMIRFLRVSLISSRPRMSRSMDI